MSFKISRQAYIDMINENVKEVKATMPDNLVRAHVVDVLYTSIEHKYDQWMPPSSTEAIKNITEHVLGITNESLYGHIDKNSEEADKIVLLLGNLYTIQEMYEMFKVEGPSVFKYSDGQYDSFIKMLNDMRRKRNNLPLIHIGNDVLK